MRHRVLFRAAGSLLAFALLAGCSDQRDPIGADHIPAASDQGLYPTLTVSTPSEQQSVVSLSLHQVPGGIELASVQGEIQYDATTLHLNRVSLPDGVEGDSREVSPGHVRFVGTMVKGVAEAPLLRLEFAPAGETKAVALRRDMFQVNFDEVTGGADLSDLTANVRSGKLLFLHDR